MPGFVVNGDFGGHRLKAEAKQEYYYSYFWEINNLFGTPFEDRSVLINLKEAGLPTFTVAKDIVRGASLEYKFAKGICWDDVKVSWYDAEGLIDVIKQWRESVWTPECGLKSPNDYKKWSHLITYLPSNKGEINWVLINSWPSVIRYGDLTYAESNIKLIEVNVTYDWAEEKSNRI